MTLTPFVSVVMPVRNEAAFIRESLGSVLAQDYPIDRMEIFVVDGDSEDETAQIAASISSSVDGRAPVTILHNRKRVVPAAMNLAIGRARGEIVVRVDGHCQIENSYVRRCVEIMGDVDAACVGGRVRAVGETLFARATALAQSSGFGVGGVAFRTGRRSAGPVDTVAFGAYRRDVFDRHGLFDVELVRNQDDEFNFRLVQAGETIWMDPALCTVYFSRNTVRGLWRQYFGYGLYKVRVFQKRGAIASVRQLIPAAFVLGLGASFAVAGATRRPAFALLVAGPYAVVSVVTSAWAARRDPPTLPALPIAFATLHLSYGLGFLAGLWRWRHGFGKKTILRRAEAP